MSRSTDASPRRPWTLWLFSLLIAGIGLANLALAVDHVRRADHLRALGVAYPPLVRAGLAALWGAALVWTAWRLARRAPRARRLVLVVISNYGAFGVLWLLIFARSDYAQGRVAFRAALTAALIGLVWLALRWRRIRRAFEPSADSSPSAGFEWDVHGRPPAPGRPETFNEPEKTDRHAGDAAL